MKDKHKLGIVVVLLIVIIVVAISTLLKTPLTKDEKVLKDEVKSEVKETQIEQLIDENA